MTDSDVGETIGCYAHSDKSWVRVSSGIAWEAYHTMADADLFHQSQPPSTACYAPQDSVQVHSISSCELNSLQMPTST